MPNEPPYKQFQNSDMLTSESKQFELIPYYQFQGYEDYSNLLVSVRIVLLDIGPISFF